MMRAMEFMGKAQDASLALSLSEEQKAKERQIFDKSLMHLTNALGEDGPLIQELTSKMKINKAAFRADPQGSMSTIMSLVSKLMRGSEAEKEEARREIREMPEAAPTLSEEEKQMQDSYLEELAESLQNESAGAQRRLDEVNEFEHIMEAENGHLYAEDNEGNQTALMQMNSSDSGTFAVVLGTLIVGMLVIHSIIWAVAEVVMGLIIWSLVALLGCGIYHLDNGESSGVGATMKCTLKAFALPFIVIGKVATGIYQAVSDPY